ncbi:hypothetical protein GALMADRAFT_1170770 [Galerina marginata CBS 339.88]|uniref:HSF-type DNA-binding domain-containing protein n=1 Tax=Galerina marginata (strain CBS 339.88) TaxID=685588 RepID=A0A067TA23_GALM3|nr:hypothetical protein GALMADRAFT_1170770 [Galerina marginata CBS 339.88]
MSPNEPDTIDAGDNDTIEIVDHLPSPQELAMPTAVTDFARKLYKKAFFFFNTHPMAYIDLCSMLEDPSNQSIVCWGPQRDCFIVKDTNEFAKTILPRIFNHSNFASFVRQLNKYDFHKVKQTNFTQAGEQTSTVIDQKTSKRSNGN